MRANKIIAVTEVVNATPLIKGVHEMTQIEVRTANAVDPVIDTVTEDTNPRIEVGKPDVMTGKNPGQEK